MLPEPLDIAADPEPRRTAVTLHNLFGLARYLAARLRFRNLPAQRFFLSGGCDLRVHPDAQISFGPGVRFMENCAIQLRGRVSIGSNVFFNRGCYISALNALTIGDNCLFGEMVSIHDENHVVDRRPEPIASKGWTTKPIVIGSNVWVGAKATILQGVTIGDNVVIGAHSLVTRDIPANSIAVGSPAQVIREV